MNAAASQNLFHWSDEFQLIGTATSLVFYGVNVCLAIQLLSSLKRSKYWTSATTLTAFLLATACQALTSYISYAGTVGYRDDSLINAYERLWLAFRTLGLVATWVIDSFVLYQCFTIYSLYKKGLWAVGLSFLFFLSSIGSGIYLIGWTNNLGIQVLPHYPLCVINKSIMTFLIIAKLAQHRKMLNTQFCDTEDNQLTKPYTTLIWILVQSYALYAGLSVLFLSLYMAKHEAWRLVLPNTVQAGLFSHLLVRFSASRSTRDTVSFDSEKETSIQFSSTQSSECSNTQITP
ncbi:hypothetical protein NP233_g9109 [Leucocoprinus birnbaumii]|uniref:Uncharacterized protein n=1 Tax=Leucocoprinus birnbaumii TaxID=56174 RepID=A0AAD5VPI1_9AGAR|nr:hypothetical protein NP233_g9109 [Leucocoprinus birnbaumii]